MKKKKTSERKYWKEIIEEGVRTAAVSAFDRHDNKEAVTVESERVQQKLFDALGGEMNDIAVIALYSLCGRIIERYAKVHGVTLQKLHGGSIN